MVQKSLVLILARDLADKLASAMFVVDHEGTLVYFNERAEEILGRSFGEVGEMRLEEWSKAFVPTDRDGRSLATEELPLTIALNERTPIHRALRIQALDGTSRDIAVTALPLFAREEELAGAAAVFWEHSSEGTVDTGLAGGRG